MREQLAAATTLAAPQVLSRQESLDGETRKDLLALADGEQVEVVLMHYIERRGACLSTQVGCAMGCAFCATGQMGFTRNLSSGEIVAQALHLQRELRARGESLSNTPTTGFGDALLWTLKSSTTNDQNAARIYTAWYEATHAIRKAELVFAAYDYNGEREGLRIRANGSAPAIAFYGGTPRTRAAALTAQLTTITYTAPTTPDYDIQDFIDVAGDGSKGYAFASRDEANTLLAVIANLQARVQELENALNAATGVNLIA